MELGINKPKKNYDEIIKLLQQEKYERLHNNIAKHLDICIKIVQKLIIIGSILLENSWVF